MKVVRFTSNYAGYNAGETAGWKDEFADALVKDGIAEHVKAKPGPKPKAKAVDKRKTKPAKNIIEK